MRRFTIGLMIMLLLGVVPVFADTDEADFDDEDRVLSIEGLSITLPEGWVGEADEFFGEIALATSEEALSIIDGEDLLAVPESGEIVIQLFPLPFEFLTMMEAEVETPAELLSMFMEMDDITGELLDYEETLGVASAVLFVDEASDIPPNALVIATEYPEGFVLWTIQYGEGDEFADYEDIIAEVILSLTYEGDMMAEDNDEVMEERQTVTLEDLTVTLPDGWVFSETFGEVYFASAQEALDIMESGDTVTPLPSGEISMSLLPLNYELMPFLEIEAEEPLELLVEFSESAGLPGEIFSYDLVDFPAAILFVDGGDGLPGNAVIMATMYPDGFVLWAIQYGEDDDLADYDEIIVEIISSLEYLGEAVYTD